MKPGDMLEKEILCVEEHAPFCMAECPVHFDARNMAMLIESGDYKSAYEQYNSAVLFPGIVSSECEAPCKKKCKRTEAGGSIEIRELERIVVERGKYRIKIPENDLKMSKKIALVEDEIDAIAILYLLLEKGYSPELFVSKPEIKIDGNACDDFDFINDDRVIKYAGQKFDMACIEKLAEDYDAVYFSCYTKEGFLSTFEGFPASEKFFFSAGAGSVIEKISHGKQTAISIDRFLKGVSITAGRKNEGSYETRLFTSVSGIENKPPANKTGVIYTEKEALCEAERCIKCRCMECVKQCAFMTQYERFPRKYIRDAFSNITTVSTVGSMGSRKETPAINSCTLCGLCGEICPNHIPMAEIYRSAREALVSKKVMPPRYHEFPLRDMFYSNSDKVSFFRNPKGKAKSKYMFFPGCQLIATSPEFIKPVYDYLSNVLNGEVGLMAGCCGAPAMWAGQTEIYSQVLDRFRQIWNDAGKPVIITACPTCNREFSEAFPEAEVKTVWHYYNTFPFPPKKTAETQIVSIHDPCTSRYRTDMHEEIRTILKKSGYQIEEYEYSKNMTRCCGFGGLACYGNASLAKKFADKRISETGNAIVTYCSVCRDFFANSAFGEKPVYHILDIIYGKEDRERGLREKTGISDKMKNRSELKKNLLKCIWGEEPERTASLHEEVSLIISDEVRKKLEDRLILEDNIREIIYEAEKTGGKIVNPKTGYYTAHKKIGIVTFWVEYEKAGELFNIHSAYSHRIQIVEGQLVFVPGQVQQIQIVEDKR